MEQKRNLMLCCSEWRSRPDNTAPPRYSLSRQEPTSAASWKQSEKSLHSADMPFFVAALKTYTAALENTIGEEGNKLSGEFQKIMCAARIDIDSGDSA